MPSNRFLEKEASTSNLFNKLSDESKLCVFFIVSLSCDKIVWMNKKMFVEDFCGALILGLIFLFIDYKIAIGIVVGNIFSFLNYKTIEYRFNNLESVNIFTYLGTFLSIAVLILPLIVSFLIPNIMSWIGVTIGLLINKIRLYIGAFINK